MRFLSLEVTDFGCVDRARLELGPGLNVLYGPNDLGKSTLAHAMRAALLLLPRSTIAREFKPWHSDGVPRVVLEFSADDGRIYRLEKTFGGGTRGQATLHWSNDGRDFQLEAQGRAVDGRVRELLGWGLPEAGSRGGRGFPDSFLATVLLGRQAQPGTVFESSLDTDADDSARSRLTAALQALAQDPRYKEILEHAQSQVDLAFRQDGTPRRHKDSPFRRIADRIAQLSEQLRELEDRVHDSDDVRTRLADLHHRRDEAAADRDESQRALARVREDLARARARAEATAARDAAAAAHRTILDKIEALARRRDALHAATEARPAAEAARAAAAEARDAAAEALRRARTTLEQAAEGGDASERLGRQSLLTRQAEARAAVQRADEEVRRLGEGRQHAERLAALTTELESLERELAQARRVQDDAEAARRRHDGRRRTLDAAIGLRRLQDAQRQLARAVEARQRMQAATERAAEARQAAERIERELDARGLPDAEELARLEALHGELELARARLGGGLGVAIRLDRTTPLAITSDDGEAASHPGPEVDATADSSLSIAIEGVGRIDVVAGTADARTGFERTKARWETEGASRLSDLGLDDLAGLRAAVAEADEARAEARDARRRAEADDAVAESSREAAAEVDGWTRTVTQRTEALGGRDLDDLASQVDGLDEDALRAQRVEAETAMAEARARLETASRRVAELEASVATRRREHETATQQLAAARREAGGDPTELLAAARDRLAAAEGALETVADELEEFDAARADARQSAEDALARAETAHRTAVERFEAADERRSAIDRDIAGHTGAIEAAQAEVAALDEPAARQRLADAEASLAALPAPTTEVDDETVAAAQAELQRAEAELREVEANLRKSEGALQSVGGSVVRDRANETRAALDEARRTEEEIGLDYAGWQLLVETLRQTENEEGRNLGDALVGPISERLSALTAGRYAGLELGPDLRPKGIEVAGDTRDVEEFSEGVQEQLATLLRVTIARQLGSALVLDDHLTQTDPERIAWFRDLLRDTGGEHQVVVLTCRPRDYLAEGELPNGTSPVRDIDAVGLRAVDLGRVITRAGPRPRA